jgi:hypothetical protein
MKRALLIDAQRWQRLEAKLYIFQSQLVYDSMDLTFRCLDGIFFA